MKRKHITIGVIIVIFLICAAFGSNRAWKYHKGEIKRLEDAKVALQDSIDVLKADILTLKERDLIDQGKQYNYYNDYLRERRRARDLRKMLENIANRVYPFKYLDSLRTSYVFEGQHHDQLLPIE